MNDKESRSRFQRAVEAFDHANAADPNQEQVGEEKVPHEWIDARRLHRWVLRLAPNASEALQLAARCQHICRWKIPRERYPRDREGYLKWRAELKRFHADTAASILRQVGYGDGLIRKVNDLNLKKGFGTEPEVQTLEDALCLTFLEYELETFRARVSSPRMIGILRKTWSKMSVNAREQALGLALSPAARALLAEALKGSKLPGGN